MKAYEKKPTEIAGCCMISSLYVEDDRGLFDKPFEREKYHEIGQEFSCDEVFFSHSHRNVIRGLHFQTERPQEKIIRVLRGAVFDVVVDLRQGSPSYGKWMGRELSLSNHWSLIVPSGCAHGFLTLSKDADVLYICKGAYDKPSDSGIRYDDADIGIDWPLAKLDKVIISERDAGLMSFSEYEHINRFVWKA